LHRHLCPPGVLVLGPQLDGQIDKHTTSIPFGFKGNFCVTVRNPYDRARSLFAHWVKYHNGCTWDVFVFEHLRSGLFNITISEMMRGFEPPCDYWQVENIETCLVNAGLPINIPHLNIGDVDDQDWYVDGCIKEQVRRWGAEDFELYNYKE
jgi:hypothetical protein